MKKTKRLRKKMTMIKMLRMVADGMVPLRLP
jgi:hypothetical protein